MQASTDGIPPFWTEPWRWAAAAWRREYGAPMRDFDRHAARLIYSGWAVCFGLPRQWRPPRDPRWRNVVQASPEVLAGVASVLGHIALLRAGASAALACRPPVDPWLALALQYRDVKSMRSRLVAGRGESPRAYAAGVHVLRAMARHDWPHIESRIAMLISPHEAATARNHPIEPTQHEYLTIEWIDVARCLSLCGAAVRHAASRSIAQGEQ